MRDASARGQTLVIALLVAVVNRGARKYAVAIVLVGADGTDAHIGREERHGAIDRLSEIGVGHETEASRVIAGVVKREIDVACNRINGKPVIEAVHELGELIGNWMRGGPSGSTIVGERNKNVGHAGRSEIHPGAIETPAVRSG